MRDRLSTKILPNGAVRYGVYDETGTLLRYEYIKLEDEPSVEGDVFSKANMLPDSIPRLLGLKMENPQVKDAFNVLANVGNLHVWERKCLVAEAGYTLGDLETVNITHGAGANYSTGNYSSWVYSDKISVNEIGVVSLVNPTQTNDLYYNAYSNANVLAGKYAQINPNISPTHSLAKLGFVYFFPAGNSASRNTDDGSYNITLPGKIVTGYPAGTTIDYLTSTDRNAYPDNVTDAQDAYYTLGDVQSISVELSSSTAIKYSSSISVSEDGIVNLVSPSTGAFSTSSGLVTSPDLKGKYVTITGLVGVWFILEDSKGTYKNYMVSYDKAQPVTGHAAIPANTTITYLGQLGGGARIEVGSYIGTGTYGDSNPCSITLSKDSAIVFILQNGVFAGVLSIYDSISGGFSLVVSSAGSGMSYYQFLRLNTFVSGNTISWYHKDQAYQLNTAGLTYTWVALAID